MVGVVILFDVVFFKHSEGFAREFFQRGSDFDHSKSRTFCSIGAPTSTAFRLGGRGMRESAHGR